MRYLYLLSLIDADLERLGMARKLLLTFQTPKRRTIEKVVRLRTSVPGSRTKVISAPALRTKKQRTLRRGRDQVQVLAPVDQEMRVSTFAPEPSNETSSPVAVRASSELEETISPESVGADTVFREQGAPYEKADPPSPQRKLTLRPLPARRRSTPPQTALNTPAPARPVFVTAEQIRREQVQKQTGLEAERVGFNLAAVPLTAELLTQRWISELR